MLNKQYQKLLWLALALVLTGLTVWIVAEYAGAGTEDASAEQRTDKPARERRPKPAPGRHSAYDFTPDSSWSEFRKQVMAYARGTDGFIYIAWALAGGPSGGAATDDNTVYLEKYAPVGDLAWMRKVSGPGLSVSSVFFDEGGNVLFDGHYAEGRAVFGSQSLTFAPRPMPEERDYFEEDARDFLAAYSPDGELLWARNLPAMMDEQYGNPVDEQYQYQDATLYAGLRRAICMTDPFHFEAYKSKPDGSLARIWEYSDDLSGYSPGFYIQKNGEALLLISLYDFDELSSPGLEALKINERGEELWRRRFSKAPGSTVRNKDYADPMNVDCNGSALGEDGSLYLLGRYAGELRLGETVLPQTGEGRVRAFLARLDADGAVVWARTLGPGMPQNERGAYPLQRLRLQNGELVVVRADAGAPLLSAFSAETGAVQYSLNLTPAQARHYQDDLLDAWQVGGKELLLLIQGEGDFQLVGRRSAS